MEIEELISAVEETISLLQKSESSGWATMTVEEIITNLEGEIDKMRNSQPINLKYLSLLFTPTGAIHETSIDNGSGDEFLRISEIVDHFIAER